MRAWMLGAAGVLVSLASCGGSATGEFAGWPGGCGCAVNPLALRPWAKIRCVRDDGKVGRGLDLDLPAQAHVSDWMGATLWAKSEGTEVRIGTGPARVEYGAPDASHDGQRPLSVRRLHFKGTDKCTEAGCDKRIPLQESDLEEVLFWCSDES